MSTTLITAWNRDEAPREENDVRSTTNVVDLDAPSAVAENPPGFNDAGYERDPDTEGGLTPRNLFGFIRGRQRYTPNVGNANTDFASPINDQVSTSGTAAARESAGEWGHGTMQIVESIEPTIREGGAFGEDYFAAGTRQLQKGMRSDVTAARIPDGQDSASDQQAGKTAAREAAQSALYARFLEEMTK